MGYILLIRYNQEKRWFFLRYTKKSVSVY